MADKSRTLNLKMAAVVHDDLLEVVAKEAALRDCAAKIVRPFLFGAHTLLSKSLSNLTILLDVMNFKRKT